MHSDGVYRQAAEIVSLVKLAHATQHGEPPLRGKLYEKKKASLWLAKSMICCGLAEQELLNDQVERGHTAPSPGMIVCTETPPIV